MSLDRDWLKENARLIAILQELLIHDVHVNWVALAQLVRRAGGKASVYRRVYRRPGRAPEEPRTGPERQLRLIFHACAILIFREAERLNLPTPEPDETLGEWLDKSFFPALVKSLQKNT